MRDEIDPDGWRPERKPSFAKGFAVALGIMGLSYLLLLLPPAGTILLVTFCPFIACYFGGKMGAKDAHSSWLSFGLSIALIWSACEVGLLIVLLGAFLGSVNLLEPVGLALIGSIFILNIVFCVLGTFRGVMDRLARSAH